MKNKIKLLLWLSIFFISTDTYANSLTLDQILNSVNLNFPLIKAAQQRIMQSQANYISAKGNFDPTIRSDMQTSRLEPYQNVYSTNEIDMPIKNSGMNLFTGYRYGRGDFPTYDQGRWTYPYGEANVGIEMPLFKNRKIDDRRGQLKITKYKIGISKQNLNLEKIKAIRQASFSYWDWVAEGKKLNLQRHLLKLSLLRQQVIDRRLQQGDAPVIDVIENNKIIFQRKSEVENQKQLFQKASLYLSLFYRDKKGNPITPTIEMLPEFFSNGSHNQFNLLEENHLENIAKLNPSIRKINLSRKITSVKLKLAHNQVLPKLNTRIYFANDFGSPDFDGSDPPLNRTSLNYELTFEYPLFQRKARGDIEAYEKELAYLTQVQKFVLEQIIIAIKNAYIQLNTTKKMVDYSKKTVGLAQSVERAEKIKFNNGDSNLFLVNQRELSTADAEIQEIDSIANYYKAKAELIYALGESLPKNCK